MERALEYSLYPIERKFIEMKYLSHEGQSAIYMDMGLQKVAIFQVASSLGIM